MRLKKYNLNTIVLAALKEDRGLQDITTQALFNKRLKVCAEILAKEPCVICGLEVARTAFKLNDPRVKFKSRFCDGDLIRRGSVVASISGKVNSLMAVERVALNFLSRLSGIATLTGKFVKSVTITKAKILDTRKTTPLLRPLEKYAVRCGGGYNHRFSLRDAVLIKDNHKKAYARTTRNVTLAELVDKVKKKVPAKTMVEIEVESIPEFRQALSCLANVIMLDNMTLAKIKKCVALRDRFNSKVKLEVSGNVNLKNIRHIAKSGVDFISIGALTHSSPAIDFTLEIV